MIKKFRIETLILAMLLIGIIFVASASADNSQGTLSESEIFGISESEKDRLIPDFGPQTFDELRNDSNVLTTRGQIPQYTTQEEKQNWLHKLDDSRIILRDDIVPYLYPNGPVIGYGWDIDGYFEVTLYKDMNVTETQINEIYALVKKGANETSVQEIPVVFIKGDFLQDEVSYSSGPIVFGGIKITSETGAWGTIGFSAKKSDGTKGYVTVQHLGTSIGLDMYQPTISSSNYIGDVDIISGNNADACFIEYSNVQPKIHINGVTVNVTNYVGTVPSSAWNGWEVYMSGAASGKQKGYIKGAGENLNDNGMIYYNMVKTNYSSASGDSGAPVYRKITSNEYRLLGIHKGVFNGYKWFSPISGIKSDLGVTPITA